MPKLNALIALLCFCAGGGDGGAGAGVTAIASTEFSYEGQHGPEHWGDEFKRCSGKHQSPININELQVVQSTFTELELDNFKVVPIAGNITNNGHTVMVRLSYEDGKTPLVKGGPFNFFTGYQFEQFHFHWGENDTIGSEDLINNTAFPAELHIVLRNTKYPNFETALNKDDGLAVLAYFFKLSPLDHSDYMELTDLLQRIPMKGMTADFTFPLPLENYLSSDISNYYMYTGSLTTPPCSEDVIWIDFIDPIRISRKQMNRFRQLKADKNPLMNNFRPPQPLNDRKIYRSKWELLKITEEESVPLIDRINSSNNLQTKFVWTLLASVLILVLGCN